ncbi:rop guanine nucleotide exchange factor 3-like isoform X2 [Oryza glaberrima]|nr:rop guanine nucleotide exchange factor 3-like isoform X2 [Oryza glaberrima]
MVFGSCHKLEPLPAGKKTMWRREMDCLLSVCDYIVEFYPSSRTPRWHQSRGHGHQAKIRHLHQPPSSTMSSSSFQRSTHRNEDKWWLPVPCVPDAGIFGKARKDLQQKRDCATQIHKRDCAKFFLTELAPPLHPPPAASQLRRRPSAPPAAARGEREDRERDREKG